MINMSPLTKKGVTSQAIEVKNPEIIGIFQIITLNLSYNFEATFLIKALKFFLNQSAYLENFILKKSFPPSYLCLGTKWL